MTKHTHTSKPKGKSAILGYITKQIDSMYEALTGSALAEFLCGYDRLQVRIEGSFFVSFVRRLASTLKKRIRKSPRREIGSESLGHNEVGIFVPSSLHKSLKTRLSEAVEESVFIEKAIAFLRAMLFVPLISYGVFLFAFGLSTTVVQALVFFLQGQSSGAALDLFTGLALVLLSLPAMFKGYEPLLGCMKKSVLGNLILHSVFGADKSIEERETVSRTNLLLFLAGVLCGVVTWFLPPMELVALGAMLILAVGVIFVPEAGLLLLFICFPFLGYLSHTSIVCGLAVLYVGGCWLIKVALGKRSFSVELGDALVIALMLWIFLSAFAGGQASLQSALLYLAMIFGYLTVSNLLRSKLWIKRCSDGLILSSFAVAFIGLVQWATGNAVVSLFGSQLILCCYLLSVIPLTLARLSAQKGSRGKFRYLIVLLVQSGCIFATASRLALAVWLIEIIGYCLLSSKKTLPILIILALLTPVVLCILPLFGIMPSFELSFADGRREALRELLELIGKAPLTGIGMSDGLMMLALDEGGAALTPELSNTFLRLAVQIGLPGLLLFLMLITVWYMAGFSLLSGGYAGRREKCYTRSAIITVTAMLAMGTFCYLWADYRLLMLFWCLSGLYQAVRKYSKEHEFRKTDEEIPAHDVQWINMDLYFDGNGKPKGSSYRVAPKKGGNEK